MIVQYLKKTIASMTYRIAGTPVFGTNLLLIAVTLMVALAEGAFGQAAAPQSGTQAQAQSQNAAATRFEFDIVSIKPGKSQGNFVRVMDTPDGLSVTRSSLQALIADAYQVPIAQLSGAPGWLKSDPYDIEAKMDSSVADELKKLSPDQARVERQHMLQKLLSDRCKLAVHTETKELPVYALVVAKNGPKFQEAKPGDTYPNGFKGPDGRPGAIRMQAGRITAQAVPLATLTGFLSRQSGRPVVDKTGLTGKYDFTFVWTPNENQGGMLKGPENGQPGADNSAPPDSGPSIFTALEEQLGLKLNSEKGPVQFVIIDHVERPSEN